MKAYAKNSYAIIVKNTHGKCIKGERKNTISRAAMENQVTPWLRNQHRLTTARMYVTAKKMKGTEVQTLGTVAGAWPAAWVVIIIRMRTDN